MQAKWWTLTAVLVGTFMLLLDLTIIVVALPEIERSLHANFGDVQWVVDAYALTLGSTLLTTGVLSDRYGRRRLFSIGLVIFVLGSLLCGVAQDPLMLIISRSAQGIGGAAMFSTSLALLAQSFSGRDRGVAFGAWGAVAGGAVACGPILGGLITSGWNWRGIFLVNVPIGVVALAITLWRVDESRQENPPRPDWPGFVLLTGGLVALVFGLIRAGETSWSSATVIGCIAGGAVLLVGFLITEATVAHPIFDLGLFRTPTFVGGAIAAFTMNASLFAMFVYLVLYLQDILGYSALQTGLRLLLITGPTLVVAVVAGRISSAVPVRLLIAPGLGLVAIGLWAMSGLNATTSWTALIPGFLIAGFGTGLVNPPLASTAIGVVPPERAGMASGVSSSFRQVGIAISIAGLGSIFGAAIHRAVVNGLSHTAALAPHAGALATAIRQGDATGAIDSVPPALRATVGEVVRASFAGAVNDLLDVTAIVAAFGAVASLVLIRQRDFVATRGASENAAGAPQH
jgi:EmrB/QacA subfamily drug resistance transporter